MIALLITFALGLILGAFGCVIVVGFGLVAMYRHILKL